MPSKSGSDMVVCAVASIVYRSLNGKCALQTPGESSGLKSMNSKGMKLKGRCHRINILITCSMMALSVPDLGENSQLEN